MKKLNSLVAFAFIGMLGLATPGAADAIPEIIKLKHPMAPISIDMSQFDDLDVFEMEGVHIGDSFEKATSILLQRGYKKGKVSSKTYDVNKRRNGKVFILVGPKYTYGAEFEKTENGMRQIVKIALTDCYLGNVIYNVSREITWTSPDPGQPKRNPSVLALRNLLYDTYGPSGALCWTARDGKIISEKDGRRCQSGINLKASIQREGNGPYDPAASVYKFKIYLSEDSLAINKNEGFSEKRDRLTDQVINTYLENERAKAAAQTGVLPKL